MPVTGRDGIAVFRVEIRNLAGDFVDPDSPSLTLTFDNALGVAQAGFPVYYPASIVKEAVGTYSYSWPVPDDLPLGSYTANWESILYGSTITAVEMWEIVPAGSMSTGTDGFLVRPDDYDAIRGLLGVTTLDVEDKDIDLMAFAPQAEMMVRRRVATWEALNQLPEPAFVLRMATVYKIACLMAQSFVRGGTIGLARPLSTGEGRDWVAAAEQFCGQYEYWISIADQYDPVTQDETALNATDFIGRALVVSGPTSVRLAHRLGRTQTTDPSTASWYSYPPYWR